MSWGWKHLVRLRMFYHFPHQHENTLFTGASGLRRIVCDHQNGMKNVLPFLRFKSWV